MRSHHLDSFATQNSAICQNFSIASFQIWIKGCLRLSKIFSNSAGKESNTLQGITIENLFENPASFMQDSFACFQSLRKNCLTRDQSEIFGQILDGFHNFTSYFCTNNSVQEGSFEISCISAINNLHDISLYFFQEFLKHSDCFNKVSKEKCKHLYNVAIEQPMQMKVDNNPEAIMAKSCW